MAHAGGRPPFFNNPEDLDVLVNKYFEETTEEKRTITGLALALGFADKSSIYEYEKKPEFSYSIKQARLRVENCYELSLRGRGNSGDIFALKNFGWTDKTEIDQNTTLKATVATVDITTEELERLFEK